METFGPTAPVSTPETLRKIRRDLLLTWLAPAAACLERRGLVLPAADSETSVDYDRLASVFMDLTPDMPAELVDSVFLIHGMANAKGMDILLEGAQANGLELGLGEEATAADVAVKVWLVKPRLLENLHNCQEMTRPRSFQYFSTDADPVPEFRGPGEEQLTALEERLNEFYVALKRGRGARVFAYSQKHEWWFLVRHGAPCRREGAMKDGKPTSVFFRPQRHDVVVYDPKRGEMGVNCCTIGERRFFLRTFGRCLFGRTDFFPGTTKYTLAPLLRRGRDCLACGDVPGIEMVRLREVEFYFREQPWKRVIHKADDIFGLVERAEMKWPSRLEEITRATFEVKFWRAKQPRPVPRCWRWTRRRRDGGFTSRWPPATTTGCSAPPAC